MGNSRIKPPIPVNEETNSYTDDKQREDSSNLNEDVERLRNLSSEELSFMNLCLRYCVHCERKVNFGEIWSRTCGCIVHPRNKCPSPQVREGHYCGNSRKRELITTHMKKLFPNETVIDGFRKIIAQNCPNLLLFIFGSKDSDDFTIEELWLMSYVWKICLYCRAYVDLKKGCQHLCGCVSHKDGECSSERKRDHGPDGKCTSSLKKEVIIDFVKTSYPGDSVLSAFMNYMKKECPRIIEIIKPNPNWNCPFHVDLNVFSNSDLTFVRSLGSGNYGTVNLESTKFYKKVAVKRYHMPTNWTDTGFKELISSIKVSQHPNLIQIRGILCKTSEKVNSSIGFVMEYMSGGSLDKVIHNLGVKYEYGNVLDWTRQASSALHFLHEKRMVHRDVKPSNMLVDESRVVLKLCDLGESTVLKTLGTATIGTAAYMAPELMSEEEKVHYTVSCDVHSLAISIWEMYHRTPPFHDCHNVCAIFHRVRSGNRPSIEESFTKLHPVLSRILSRGWSSKVSERPTMLEIHDFAVEELKSLDYHGHDSI